MSLLVIGATDLEMQPLRAALSEVRQDATAWGPLQLGRLGSLHVAVQALGVGKVNTAAGLALAIEHLRPRAVLQLGIAGAYVGSFLSIGLAMLADEEVQLDLGLRSSEGWADLEAIGFPAAPAKDGRPERWQTVPTDVAFTEALSTLTGLPRGRFATLDAVSHDLDVAQALQRRFDVSLESMEGAAAAAVCDRLGVPFAELRGVSNIVGDRDKGRWHISAALRAATDPLLAALPRLPEHPYWQVNG